MVNGVKAELKDSNWTAVINLPNSGQNKIEAIAFDTLINESKTTINLHYFFEHQKSWHGGRIYNVSGVNAELAESALKTVIEYMSEEEYQAFKKEVEDRLKTIIGK